jgi:hypothetical protein
MTGCATSKVATTIGVRIGTSYQEAAATGVVNAEQSIAAWPYVSGMIQGLLAEDYKTDVPPIITSIIKKLDKLSEKDILTTEDKGFVIGSFVRLEVLATQHSWDRYGVSILNMVLK